ncbi:MAG: hypothetical protein DCF16_11045 [Alphaproteobacteria bacterium]|nr:MAG: hypothetical protein DCF16_11045 [Alphaproteobacteria bacterium]
MEPVIYRRRRDRLSRSEREWRVEEDALVSRGSGTEKRYRWKDIVSVRLTAEPLSGRPWRYVFELQPRHQRKIVLDNAHFISPGAYEDRSAAYTPFVRAAAAGLAATNPKAQALIGETPKRYFFLLLVALLALCGLAYVLVALPNPLDNLPYSNLLKFGAILLMLPVFWRWVLKAMPRGVALDAIPERALPPVAGS